MESFYTYYYIQNNVFVRLTSSEIIYLSVICALTSCIQNVKNSILNLKFGHLTLLEFIVMITGVLNI